jgi:hypothetical protein
LYAKFPPEEGKTKQPVVSDKPFFSEEEMNIFRDMEALQVE